VEKREMELEENLRRKDLTWQEEILAKKELHTIRMESGEGTSRDSRKKGWSQKDTASMLGDDPGTLSKDLELAYAILLMPALKDEPNKTQAYNKYSRMIDTQIRTVVAEVKGEEDESISDSPSTSDGRKKKIYKGNCAIILSAIDPQTVDCIITDPPFGVDLDQNFDLNKKYEEVYKNRDDYDSWFDMMQDIVPRLHKVLKDDGHMYIFYASKHTQEIMDICATAGFSFDPIPNIWYKGETGGTSYRPHERFRPNYEPFLFCWKKDQQPRKLTTPHGCVFDIPGLHGPVKRHPAQKPPKLGGVLCDLSTVPGEVVLDPFCGMGSLLEGAYWHHRKVIGIELDPKYYTMCLENLGAKPGVADEEDKE